MISIEENKTRFLQICKEHISRDGVDKLLAWLEKSDFFEAPASTRFHGSYEGGLLEHSLNVYDALSKLNTQFHYEIPEESIAICALLHDICKIGMYKKGYRNVKDENGAWVKKEVYEIDEKIPLGHGEKSCILLQWYMKLKLEELLAIRWHMGGFDSAVKGGDFGEGNAYNQCKLAVLLHMADMTATYLMEVK